MGQTRREFLHAGLGAGVILAVGAGPDAELTRLTLREASEGVRTKAISPVELTAACLRRIERLNPKLNAFITVAAEQAMDRARELEADIRGGKWRGPLHGIPIALKDNIDTSGIKTTAASKVFADRIPSEDAEVVRRLKAAGAVLLGKTNMDEFAFGHTSRLSHFGAVHNPWKLDRIAGGSSGGSAAAVAANLCYGALGTDTGGSIRQPAAYCGIAGLRPTCGLVGTRGVVPLSWSLDTVGPMCRTIADTAILLAAIAGYDPGDTTSINAPAADYEAATRGETSALRLGIPRTLYFEDLHPEIEKAVNAALERLRRLTAGLREVELPAIPKDMFGTILGAESYTFHASYLAKMPQLYQAEIRQRAERLGPKVTAAMYIESRRDLDRLRRAVGSVFAGVDLLVTPTTPIPPTTIDEEGPHLSHRNMMPISVYGLPAISIPCGYSESGLPIGLQIVGPRFGEPKALALAHAYERATEWHKRRPPL
jgi:aspartyl-tRNA(Asn)/glutamyl-tRNA(Gln) amidotransferase subunit A